MLAGYLDLAVFLQAPSPPVAWVGGFLFWFLGSALELISVEAQGELGFGMRIKGLWGLPGWCPKGERIGRAAVPGAGPCLSRGLRNLPLSFQGRLLSSFDAPGERMGARARPGLCRRLS